MSQQYEYSIHFKERIKKRNIQETWVLDTISNYDYKMEVSYDEIHYFKKIQDNEYRCLKVVVNPVINRIVTAYFDRRMTKRGCTK